MKTLTTSDSTLTYSGQIISRILGSQADKKRVIAFIIPPVLIAIMYPIFNSLAGVLANDRIA